MNRSVCVITNAWPDSDSSCHGVFIRRLAEDLAKEGWRSHVLVPKVYRTSRGFEKHSNHTVRRFRFLSAGRLLIEYEGVPYFRLSTLFISGLISGLSTVLRRRCTLIHAHWAFPAGLIALAVARLTGRPLLLTVHGSDQRLAAGRGGAAERVFAMVARGATRVISVSEPISDYIRTLGLPEERLATRPLGVDDSLFNTSAPPSPAFPGRINIISTRNLFPLYRVEDLLQAFLLAREHLPVSGLALAGEGSSRPALERLAAGSESSGEIRFLGHLSQNELASRLRGAEIYVSTSPADGASVSLLEAMACGSLPVVTDIPSNRAWVVHGENGLLFPPGDTRALAECLVRAAGDKSLRASAGETGPRIVAERGLWRDQVRLTESLYRELAAPLPTGEHEVRPYGT